MWTFGSNNRHKQLGPRKREKAGGVPDLVEWPGRSGGNNTGEDEEVAGGRDERKEEWRAAGLTAGWSHTVVYGENGEVWPFGRGELTVSGGFILLFTLLLLCLVSFIASLDMNESSAD